MKKKYLLFIACFTVLGTAFGQDQENLFSKNDYPVRAELEEWDPIRGPWLSSSLEAISKQEAIPDRTFPRRPYTVSNVISFTRKNAGEY